MVDATMSEPMGIADTLRALLSRFTSGGGGAGTGAQAPGGNADARRTAQAVAAAPDAEVGGDRVRCPVAVAVTVTTRAGDLPLRGIVIEADGRLVGRTNAQGLLRAQVSACDGRIRLKAIYENQAARLKREEFTLEITGIDMAARRATGGRARNFIPKVQDVFGSGAGGFPGDKDFDDSYSGADLVSVPAQGQGAPEVRVSVKMATLSLDVPYRNQNDASETVNGVTTSGSVLCMPSSAEMQARYWGIQSVATAADGAETRAEMDRLDVMQKAYDRNPRGFRLGAFPRHWQDWTNLRGAMTDLSEAHRAGGFTVNNGPASNADVETIPSGYADRITARVAQGVPVVTSTYATDGHVMIVIGAVVKHDDESEWLILNDPNGTLASVDSIYGTLDLTGSVGAGGANAPADVRAVQEALIRTRHYTGEPGAAINGDDPNDPTIAAIRAFQGRGADGVIDAGGQTMRRLNQRVAEGSSPKYSAVENERNGPTGDRGRHVYYNGGTEGDYRGNFRLKGQAWTSVVEPTTALTVEQIAQRMHPGTYRRQDEAEN
ncbi:C39 family peptidase [Paracoccus sp. DMF-8]|uniref:C39 family peptidase n=1 Tax=Paracoccus sp. DMF-8 TaxID=3019445 RepID=UPI0023E3FD14|nr:C39 family peptidase [Paracoccus sp. DMF-8]MDF3608018.1 C39 family peptidase [Paracoccus sp. DMF-8]